MNTRRLSKDLERALERIDFGDIMIEAVKDAIAEIDFEDVIKRACAVAAQAIIDKLDEPTNPTD